jgi:hypothetical protein
MMEAAGGSNAHREVLPFGIEPLDEALPGGDLGLSAEFSDGGQRPLCAPAPARVGLHLAEGRHELRIAHYNLHGRLR